MGIRDSVGRLFGFATSFLSVFILGSLVFPGNFLVLFLITFVGNMGSIVCHLMIKEAPYEAAESRTAPDDRKSNFLQPLRDGEYRWYLLFIVFVAGNLSMGGIYTNLGIERFKTLYSADKFAGILSVLTMCSGALFSFLMGRYCEKAGKFKAFLVLVSALIFIPVLTVVSRNLYLYLVAFFLNGITFSLLFIDFSTVLGFGDMESRHSYLSLNSIIKLVPIVLFGNIGGYLADRFSPELTLLLSAAFCCPGLLILLFKLRPFLVSGARTASARSAA
jgi:predicted MFS family arabinose efflux permease